MNGITKELECGCCDEYEVATGETTRLLCSKHKAIQAELNKKNKEARDRTNSMAYMIRGCK